MCLKRSISLDSDVQCVDCFELTRKHDKRDKCEDRRGGKCGDSSQDAGPDSHGPSDQNNTDGATLPDCGAKRHVLGMSQF